MAYKIRPATIVESDERLDRILKMLRKGLLTFVVVDKGKYKGIITDRTLHTLQHDPNMKAGTLAWKAPPLTRDMALDDLAERFVHGYRELPVCDNSKVIGVLRHTDLLRSLLEEGRVPKRRVTEIMSAPLISTDAKTGAAQAAALMRQNNVHHLAVTENGKFIGVVSTSDLAPLIEKTVERLPFVRERMGVRTLELRTVLPSVPEMHTISQSTWISEAAEMMVRKDISTLIVFDGRPMGLVHALDIVRASLPEVVPPLEIVGLEEEDKEHRDAIRSELTKLLQKVERSLPVETAKLTVKKHRKSGVSRAKYSLRFVLTGKRRITVDAFSWDLFKALHYITEEVEKIAKVEKEKIKGKMGLGHLWRRLSGRIQLGEIFPGKPEK